LGYLCQREVYNGNLLWPDQDCFLSTSLRHHGWSLKRNQMNLPKEPRNQNEEKGLQPLLTFWSE
jgi:hypothetical protein